MYDFPVDLIQATVQVDQKLAHGERTVGTGFLVSATTSDGAPRTILITANHVLSGMPGGEARIGYRTVGSDGVWRYTPQPVTIRDAEGEPLWTRHPSRDVAAITIQAPPEFARAAIPAGYLAAEPNGVEQAIAPGAELMVLGFPRGVAANNAGFPILRSGRVASYPISPEAFPTFLLDFSVFPGNSGGPVFVSRPPSAPGGASRPFVAGLLTQQVEMSDERLEIGIVTHSRYILETLALMDGLHAPIQVAEAKPKNQAVKAAPRPEPEHPGAQPASDTPERRPSLLARPFSILERGAAWLETTVWDLADRLVAWVAPNRALARGDATEASSKA